MSAHPQSPAQPLRCEPDPAILEFVRWLARQAAREDHEAEIRASTREPDCAV